MFKLLSPRSRRRSSAAAAIARAARPAVEGLEGRQLMSATVPGGYVKVGQMDVNSDGSLADAGIALDAGKSYFVVASGTHVLAPGRNADAQSYQKTSGGAYVLGGGPHLHVPGVSSWGTIQSDHVYGAQITGTGAEATGYISDSYYGDNSGSLHVDVYEQVTLDSLTATDASNSTNSVTAADAGGGHLYLLEDQSGHAAIDLSADVTPAGAGALWTVQGSGASASSGTFATSASITFTPADREFTVQAGIDSNNDGQLSGGEVTRTLDITVVKVEFDDDPFSTFLNTRNSLGVTVTPSSAADHVKLVIGGGAGGGGAMAAFDAPAEPAGPAPATFDGGASELTLSPSLTSVPVFGGNVFGTGASPAAVSIGVELTTADFPEPPIAKEIETMSLAAWVQPKVQAGYSNWLTQIVPDSINATVSKGIKDDLTFIADPANNDPRQQQAALALDSFNNGGDAQLKQALRDYWASSILQLGNSSTADGLKALDTQNLAGLGNIRGLGPGDTGTVSIQVTPVISLQAIDTIIANGPNHDWGHPGLILDRIGASFKVTGIPDTELSFDLTTRWKSTAPEWKDALIDGALNVKLLDLLGGTVNLKGEIDYNTNEGRFDDPEIGINAKWAF